MAKKRKLSVLVIDDDPSWRPLLVTLLEDEFEVQAESSYNAALTNLLQRQPPYHVVVTDIRYKDEEKGNEDGLRLVEQLNRMQTYSRVIVITGYPSIKTAKQAIGRLETFDYLEKFPPSGEFDIESFQEIVRHAAREAEKDRRHGFVPPNLNILLLEPNTEWREKLIAMLKTSPYSVRAPETALEMLAILENPGPEYPLVIFDEGLARDVAQFFSLLSGRFPDARKIMFTTNDIGNIINLVQEQDLLNVFTISGSQNQFDPRDFQHTVRTAFSAEATRYAAIRIYPADPSRQLTKEVGALSVGKPYYLALSLQNEREPGTTSIWLTQHPEKRGYIRLKTFIYAAKARLDPGAEAYWNIPINELPQPLVTELTPAEPGSQRISIEIKYDMRWLGTITKYIDVI